jgi:uncharacterized protein
LNWYLDASVLVPLHIAEPRSQTVTDALDSAGGDFVVSTLAAGEFASSVSRRVRMAQVPIETANAWLNLFDEWAVTDTVSLKIEDNDIARAASLVRRFELKLLMPDAVHLGLCVRHELALVTLDIKLAEAARVLGVEVVWPE